MPTWCIEDDWGCLEDHWRQLKTDFMVATGASLHGGASVFARIPPHEPKKSSCSCLNQVNVSYQNKPSVHYPPRGNVPTPTVAKWSHVYTSISPTR